MGDSKYHTLADLSVLLERGGKDAIGDALGTDHALVLVPDGDEFPVAGDETQRWDTRDINPQNIEDTEAGGRVSPWVSMASPKCLIVPLLKRSERNPFQGVISVGRAPNNDIQLTATSVSKLHAFVLQGEPEWHVTDKGSSNGTCVNNVRLEANVRRQIQPGDELRFGGVRCMFVDVSGLTTLVQLMSRQD